MVNVILVTVDGSETDAEDYEVKIMKCSMFNRSSIQLNSRPVFPLSSVHWTGYTPVTVLKSKENSKQGWVNDH